MNSIAFGISCATLVLLICVCVGSVVLKYANPAASRIPLPDAGGSQAGFDILPCVTRSLALVPPLAEPPSPVAKVTVTGRGLNKDYYCADDVAITITDKEIWLEVDKDNLLRVKRIKRLHVNDWRKTDAKIS